MSDQTNNPTMIDVRGLSKWFRRYSGDRPTDLKSAVLSGFRRLKPEDQFWALQDVSFAIPKGRMVGLIGANGAGKSTMLRLLGGVGQPDKGSITVQGRIGALLDLGAGFHPDLTGRENIFISGVISGLTRQEVAQRFDSIVAFSELEQFIDSPLRTYSTGMAMRLGFSVAAHIEPEVLLVDEVLAVGDLAFQRKCLDRIAKFREDGCTIVLVSHDMASIEGLCDEVIWLKKGQIEAHGPTEVVIGQYVAAMRAETLRRTPVQAKTETAVKNQHLRIQENRFGSLEAEITDVRLRTAYDTPAIELNSGDALRVEIDYVAPQRLEAPIFGVSISRADGFVCYDVSTESAGVVVEEIDGRGRITFEVSRLDLIGGEYFVDVGIYEHAWAYAYDYHWHVYSFLVRPTRVGKGIINPPSTWQVEAPVGEAHE